MRLTKLTAAAAAAASLAALAGPAAAGARALLRPVAAGLGGCHVTVNAEPRLVTTGENAEIFGALICHPASGFAAVGQPVSVYAHTVGIPGLRVVATATTGAGGAYAVAVNGITADTTYYVSAAGARSGRRIIRVAPVVTLRALAYGEGATLRTGPRNAVKFVGSVLPGDNGATVWLERESRAVSESWIVIDKGVVHGSTFTILHGFLIPGDANLRVIVRPHGAFKARGISNTLSFEVSQRQNPNLTINTSSYSVPYASTVTLTGAIRTGGSQKLTLFGRRSGMPGPATIVAETTTTNGSYTFTIPSATASTLY
jgi:hypothetical protein